jgi:hypothetical protein
MASVVLKDKLFTVHAYMVKNNYKILDLLFIEVVNKNNVLTAQNKLVSTNNNVRTYQDIVVDYESLTIDFINGNNDQDFAINIFLDRATYEAMLIAMNNDINTFNNNILAYFRLNINGVEERAPVYSFESYDALFTTDTTKKFRIKTLYGIGYLGLVDATDPRASNYGIVVDDTGPEPIIKYLEIVK